MNVAMPASLRLVPFRSSLGAIRSAAHGLQFQMPSCALCSEARPLQMSHIVPAFVWTWLKASSPGHIRGADAPNRRIQDGPKIPLLCHECEEKLSVWEQEFARNIFAPMHAGGDTPLAIPYRGTWALKSCVSVSWRVLQWCKTRGLGHLSDSQREQVEITLRAWADVLNGRREHPGEYEQHLIPLDVVESHTMDELSPFMNRYLTRAVHVDVLAASGSVLTYTKMARALLIGFVDPPADSAEWASTKVHVREGTVGQREMGLPLNLFNFINEKATKLGAKLAELSSRQKEKVDELFRQKMAELPSSDAFRAMQYDVAHSGRDAFRVTGDLSDSDSGGDA